MFNVNTESPMSKTLAAVVRNTPYMVLGERLHGKVEKFLLMNKYVNSIFKLTTFVVDPDSTSVNKVSAGQMLQAFVSNTKRSLPMLRSDDKYEVPYLHLDKRTTFLHIALKDGSNRVLGRYLRRYVPETYQVKYLANISISSRTFIGGNDAAIPYTDVAISIGCPSSIVPGIAVLTYAVWLQIPSVLKMLSTWHRKALHAQSTTVSI